MSFSSNNIVANAIIANGRFTGVWTSAKRYGDKGMERPGSRHELYGGNQDRVFAGEFNNIKVMMCPGEDKIFTEDNWSYGVPSGCAKFDKASGWKAIPGWEEKVAKEFN